MRTNLKESDINPVKDKLNNLLFKEVPLGVSSEGGLLQVTKKSLEEVLNRGMEYLKIYKIIILIILIVLILILILILIIIITKI